MSSPGTAPVYCKVTQDSPLTASIGSPSFEDRVSKLTPETSVDDWNKELDQYSSCSASQKKKLKHAFLVYFNPAHLHDLSDITSSWMRSWIPSVTFSELSALKVPEQLALAMVKVASPKHYSELLIEKVITSKVFLEVETEALIAHFHSEYEKPAMAKYLKPLIAFMCTFVSDHPEFVKRLLTCLPHFPVPADKDLSFLIIETNSTEKFASLPQSLGVKFGQFVANPESMSEKDLAGIMTDVIKIWGAQSDRFVHVFQKVAQHCHQQNCESLFFRALLEKSPQEWGFPVALIKQNSVGVSFWEFLKTVPTQVMTVNAIKWLDFLSGKEIERSLEGLSVLEKHIDWMSSQSEAVLDDNASASLFSQYGTWMMAASAHFSKDQFEDYLNRFSTLMSSVYAKPDYRELCVIMLQWLVDSILKSPHLWPKEAVISALKKKNQDDKTVALKLLLKPLAFLRAITQLLCSIEVGNGQERRFAAVQYMDKQLLKEVLMVLSQHFIEIANTFSLKGATNCLHFFKLLNTFPDILYDFKRLFNDSDIGHQDLRAVESDSFSPILHNYFENNLAILRQLKTGTSVSSFISKDEAIFLVPLFQSTLNAFAKIRELLFLHEQNFWYFSKNLDSSLDIFMKPQSSLYGRFGDMVSFLPAARKKS